VSKSIEDILKEMEEKRLSDALLKESNEKKISEKNDSIRKEYMRRMMMYESLANNPLSSSSAGGSGGSNGSSGTSGLAKYVEDGYVTNGYIGNQ
jgi:hypothetical protein